MRPPAPDFPFIGRRRVLSVIKRAELTKAIHFLVNGPTGESGSAEAGTTATVEYPLYWWEIGTYDCTLYGTTQDYVYGSANVFGTISLGSVSFTNPNPPVIRYTEQVTLTFVIVASNVPPGTPVGVQVSTNNHSGQVTIEVVDPPGNQSVGTGNNSNQSQTFTVHLKAASDPTSSVTATGHVKLVAVQGTPDGMISASTGEKDTSNQMTVQHP